MLTYMGLNVLDVPPEGSVARDWSHDWDIKMLDPKSGARSFDVPSETPEPEGQFTWRTFSASETQSLIDFLDAQQGKRVPFWLPTWQRDLTLLNDVSGGATSIKIAPIEYADVWAGSFNRRHVAFVQSGAIVQMGKIASIDATLVDGLNVTIPAATVAYSKDRDGLCFLRLCRQNQDDATLSFYSNMVCETVLKYKELPTEAPA